MNNNEQDILNAIELEGELQEVSPSQHEIQDRMRDDINSLPRPEPNDIILQEPAPEYFQLESIPSAQLVTADVDVTETTPILSTQRRRRRTGQELIDYRLEQAELAAEKTATKAANKLKKAQDLAEKRALALTYLILALVRKMIDL